jgi:hypothetical protein
MISDSSPDVKRKSNPAPERILDKRIKSGKVEYKVKWKGH